MGLFGVSRPNCMPELIPREVMHGAVLPYIGRGHTRFAECSGLEAGKVELQP